MVLLWNLLQEIPCRDFHLDSASPSLHASIERTSTLLGARAVTGAILSPFKSEQAILDKPSLVMLLRKADPFLTLKSASNQSLRKSSLRKNYGCLFKSKISAGCEYRQRKKVRFESLHMVHSYEPIAGLQSKIWWCRRELEQNRREERLCSHSDMSVDEYVSAYTEAYRESCSGNQLSTGKMEALIHGLELGYRGLEYIVSEQNRREIREDTRRTVASVVSVYKRVNRVATNEADISRLLRSHSVALTHRKRHWATVLGHADHIAVHNLYSS